jgi:predicted 3-demethylubiquinone-9 3-methyltransferase (glyoxalase superfamily)
VTKATTFLWFDNQAEEAAEFYVSVFRDAKVIDRMPGPGGKAMGVTIRIGTQEFICFNGGPHYKLSPAVSIFISVETQAEIDELWAKLPAGGGGEHQCGWLWDRFGLSWQVIPSTLGKLLGAPDREKAGRAMQAMLQMKKLDIAGLQVAFDGRELTSA